MKDYQFAYGKGSVTVPLDERSVLAVLHGNEALAMQDIRAGLVESLENPITGPAGSAEFIISTR